MTRRGPTPTPPWLRRLGPPLLASVVLHAAMLVVHGPTVRVPKIPVVVNQTVEFGLEAARPATAPRVAAPTPPTPPAPPSPSPAEPPRARTVPVEPARVRVPDPPDTRLREPVLARAPDTVLVARPEDAGLLDAALALNDASTPDESALAVRDAGRRSRLASRDAGRGDDAEVPRIALSVAGDGGAASAAMAEAAGPIADAIPAGTAVTLLLRTDRLRDSPNAPAVRSLLEGIRDWQQVLGGTELDPLRDFDAVLLASANPFGTAEHPPDLMAVVRTHARRDFLRASVEQMAGVRAATLPPDIAPDAGTLRAHFAVPDAGALPRAARPIWARNGGVETTTVDRYLGPTAVALLGDDLAVFASPQRMPTLLAVLGGRGGVAAALPHDDPAGPEPVVALLEARGVRNLLVSPGRGTPVPSAIDLTILGTRDPETRTLDGGARLHSVWRFDTPVQATTARHIVEALLLDVQESLDQFAGTLQGRIAVSTGVVRLGRLRSALTRLQAGADGSTMTLDATLDAGEVSEVLNAQRLAGLLR